MPKAAPVPVKTLVIVRHAHRDTANRSLDNGLTKKGKRQARRLLAYYKIRFPKVKPLIVSSPKKRCVETIQPAADYAGAPLVLDRALLDVALPKGRFSPPARVAGFLHWWRKEAPETVVVCSHGGWITAALRALTGADLELKKGGWAEVELAGGRPRLAWLIQSFKFFD
jgi:broad specificity phosphatase PhoE